jgi:hypothetical protein
MRYFILAIVLIPLFFSGRAEGQGFIYGKVSENNSNEPLYGVYVIYGRNLGTSTEEDGSYRIKADTGRLSITFQFIGYTPVTKYIHLKSGETVELDIRLETATQAIDQVVVSANRTEQKIAELTVSLDIIKSNYRCTGAYK